MHGIAGTRKTALVTGASSGIGLELAALLARDGHGLVLVAQDAVRLEAAAADLREGFGVPVMAIACDMSQPGAAASIFGRIEVEGIDLDVLVNDAGFAVYGPFRDTDVSSESRMVQVNIVCLTELTKHILPGMVARGRGRILNLGSTASFAPCPLGAVYAASKAYVLSFSEALAEELVGTGVSVTALCPGATRTRFAERAGMTRSRLFSRTVADAGEVARAGYDAMLRGRRSVVPGFANRMMVWSMRLAPRAAVARISKSIMSSGDGARGSRTA